MHAPKIALSYLFVKADQLPVQTKALCKLLTGIPFSRECQGNSHNPFDSMGFPSPLMLDSLRFAQGIQGATADNVAIRE